MKQTYLVVLAVAAIAAFSQNPAHARNVSIIVDHSTGATSYSDVLQARKGDRIEITINNTEKGCYTYNLKEFSASINAIRPAPGLAPPALPHTDTVTFSDVHNGRTSAYEVTIKKRDNAPNNCVNQNFEKRFEFIVEGWNIAFSGAATLDKLVSPAFYLEPGSMNDMMGQSTEGFFVRRNNGAEDDRSIGFAMMAHLYHTELLLWPDTQLQWAPLSFGFGVAEESATQLYLGTSLKFGDRFFLTYGKVWGDVDRLPTNIALGDFTESASAISTLGSRNDSATFLSFSYLFGDVDLAKFTSPFAVKKPEAN